MDDDWTRVDAYFDHRLGLSDPALEAALAANAAAGLPAIDVSPVQGKLLRLLAAFMGARRILEVGTLGGYSTIHLARALPADGALVSLEISPRHAEVARANIAAAGLADRVTVRVGPALESLDALIEEAVAPFDFVFIDADKQNNAAYVDRAIRLSRSGAAIVVDNVVRRGAVLDESGLDPNAAGTRRLFDLLAERPELDATALQTVGAKGWDGFVLAIKR